MNFKGHFIGGTISGLLLGSLAAGISKLPLVEVIHVVLITIFFSLFPDVDTKSIPQRWFYRVMIVVLFICSVNNYFQLATLLAVIAFCPLVSKHRGWTHSLLAPILAPQLIAFVYYHFFVRQLSLNYAAVYKVYSLLYSYKWLALACMLGWGMHLILDYAIPNGKA